MPKPVSGYWVDRRSLEFSNQIYKCPRDTCVGQPSTTSSRRRQLTADDDDADDDDDNDLGSSCWDMEAYIDDDDDTVAGGGGGGGGGGRRTDCTSDALLCKEGSCGALCSSCENTFIYLSAERVCVACKESQVQALAVAIIVFVGAFVTAGLHFSGALYRLPAWVSRSKLFGVLRQVDSGALRVAWANYQVSFHFFSLFFNFFC
jgi:hypothetical protein